EICIRESACHRSSFILSSFFFHHVLFLPSFILLSAFIPSSSLPFRPTAPSAETIGTKKPSAIHPILFFRTFTAEKRKARF
ncbi:hypothetical protein, partial [uncultured Bacteroides sp.]|uniref:hypothetical protein n=1 Tax=uncultured Bacteroides sp. TaxID=162156 RepID=UPI0026233626